MKVYKTAVLVFKDRHKYVEGEHRYRNGYARKNPRKMVKMWARPPQPQQATRNTHKKLSPWLTSLLRVVFQPYLDRTLFGSTRRWKDCCCGCCLFVLLYFVNGTHVVVQFNHLPGLLIAFRPKKRCGISSGCMRQEFCVRSRSSFDIIFWSWRTSGKGDGPSVC